MSGWIDNRIRVQRFDAIKYPKFLFTDDGPAVC